MGADLYFMALVSEQLTVVSERGSIVAVPRLTGHKGSVLQDMSAIYWTSEVRTIVNYCSFASGIRTPCGCPGGTVVYILLKHNMLFY